ncbi:sugar phosphate isomerase/epimerase family protein [Halomarina halobia]|uniref:Sugar phosphate isomerase/epimerase family protein n=1 Tax=Halomarina halobia TaxID=3033386 RepID=A0ABD6AF59_9EURY|nr:sugar phosphate isomerase/epimerase [Halomarina sp. PSR21]
MRPAIQLYTVRDIDEPLPELVRRVAAAGFEGVEFATRVAEADPKAVGDALAEAGVEPIGAHVDLRAIEADLDAVAERYRALGVTRLVIPHLPVTHYRTPGRLDELAARLNAVGSALADRGLSLVYHNQVHDFLPVHRPSALERFLTAVHPHSPGASKAQTGLGLLGDRALRAVASPPVAAASVESTAYGRLVARTSPEAVAFEVDVGGVTAAGYDPGDVLDFVGDRAPLVHMKDVVVDGDPGPLASVRSTNPGRGLVDFPGAARAAERNGVDWLVFEHDHPEDPITTLRVGADTLIDLTSAVQP